MDTLILAGSDQFMPTYPPVSDKALSIAAQPGALGSVFREAWNYAGAARGNFSSTLESYDDPKKKGDKWMDEYKRAMTIIKHHVIVTVDGDVELLEKDSAPVDTHDCLGLRLPEELYMYLSRGAVGPRVLNWFTRGERNVPTPLAGAEGPTYQSFERSQMAILRKEALCLITDCLHHYYQRADFRTRYWFDRNLEEKFKPADINPSPRVKVAKWNVRSDLLAEVSPIRVPEPFSDRS